MKVKSDPVDMVIVQAYLPTTDYEDEGVDKLEDQLEEILGKQKGTGQTKRNRQRYCFEGF